MFGNLEGWFLVPRQPDAVRNIASILDTTLIFLFWELEFPDNSIFHTQLSSLYIIYWKRPGYVVFVLMVEAWIFLRFFRNVVFFKFFVLFMVFLEFSGIIFLHLCTLTCTASDFVFRIDHDNALIQYWCNSGCNYLRKVDGVFFNFFALLVV